MHPRQLGAPLLILLLALLCSVAAKQAREYTGELFAAVGVLSAVALLWEAVRASRAEDATEHRQIELTAAAATLDELAPRLLEGALRLARTSEECAALVRETVGSLTTLAQSIEALSGSAGESDKSRGDLEASNETATHAIAALGASVRETTTSIDEMVSSIRDVARSIEALALTSEETSSSMNEIDLSIEQVQSNATETARLSEELATDAENGAEAILKTLGEIGRIQESSREAVSVISVLGTRIDTVGQILAVIDDVAEQTNLLALNAAIIAAQAGEHGKGFAVVADEIKDLAERAGGSTKEIAELVKTIQVESRNAILAVERGAQNVERGVAVSAEAERALKKLLESAQKSSTMVRAIARATIEQAKGSKQVTDAVGRIAATVQHLASATSQQARGTELMVKSAERTQGAAQNVERSTQEQTRGSRLATGALIELGKLAQGLNGAQRTQLRGGARLLESAQRIEEAARAHEEGLRQLSTAAERVRRAAGG